MTRVYLPDGIENGQPVTITGDEAHHLLHVVRVRVGDRLGLFDGRGRAWVARVDRCGRREVVAVELLAVAAPAEPPVRVVLAAAVLKGDQMDAVVRDATVMGACAVQPVTTAHVTVPTRTRRSDAPPERWHRVAVAAARQCGRAVLPALRPVRPIDEVLGGAPTMLVCLEPAAGDVRLADWRQDPRPDEAILFVGPEGGWSADECRRFEAVGARAVHLGPRTLRAEVTPIVALTQLWSVWGWH